VAIVLAMIRIAVIGDVHDEQGRLGAALDLLRGERFDLAVLAGDIGQDPPWGLPARRSERDGHDDSVRRVVDRVRRELDCPVVFVPGNHDLDDPPQDVDGINADGRTAEVAGLRIGGFGGAGPARFGFPYEWTEKQARGRLGRQFASDDPPPDLFLCHTPPVDTSLDRTHRGRHVGSRSVRDCIGQLGPRLFVCGHIHEAWGLEQLDGVPCLNAGSLGEPYGQVLAWKIDWDAGPTRIQSLRRTPEGDMEHRDWPLPKS
jgi:Icc-related predicted phosphoesterase